MPHYEIEGELEMSADSLWRKLRNFGDVGWLPGRPEFECDGEGVGAIRTIAIRGLPTVREQLDAVDEESRTVHYRIVDGSPMPVTDYRASMQVVDLGDGRSRLVWSSEWEPKGVTEEQAREAVRSLYSGVMALIRKSLPVY